MDILSEIYFNDCYIDGSCQLSCHANDYIWILHRSKNNTLEAWHPVSHQLQTTICLNQIFDRLGKTKEQLALINDLSDQDDDSMSWINEITITSFLISDEQLWIGTSTGILYVFDYKFHLKRSSPSDSGVSTMENELIGDRIDERRPIDHYSTTTSTSIESCETNRSSFPQTDDESDNEDRRIENRTKKSIERSSIGIIELNLSFKAKITDSPVKYLNRTNSLPLVISCSGQLGDDEIVCRWHRISNTVGLVYFLFVDEILCFLLFLTHLESMDERCHRRIIIRNDETDSASLCLSRISAKRFQGSFDVITTTSRIDSFMDSFVRSFYTD